MTPAVYTQPLWYRKQKNVALVGKSEWVSE